jgi:hypothetical protein
MAPCTTQGTGLATYSTWCKSCGAPNYVEFGACHAPYVVHGGERGIRTLGPDFVGTHDFQSCPFSLSGISPTQSISSLNQLYLIPLTYRLSPRERDVLAHFVRSASLRSPNPLPLTREGPHPTFTLLCTQSAWLANRSFSIGWRRE